MKGRKASVRDLLERAVGAGYRAFECTRDTSAYGWVITPSHNLLYVECALGGFRVTLCYKPSRENGTGCSCLNRGLQSEISCVDMVVLAQLELSGLLYAESLGASLYTPFEVESYFDLYWDRENVVELDLPCGGCCEGSCPDCPIQQVFAHYAELTGQSSQKAMVI